MKTPYFRAFIGLIFILLIKTVFVLFILFYSGIGLAPDEAQYWTWSQELSLGYYSKPPGIAWQIWLSSFFIGNTELGIRSSALVIGFLIPLVTFWLARAANLRPATVFWSGVLMALTPMGILASMLATTDGGYILFWTLACTSIVKALNEKGFFPGVWIGLCIMGGALFKWPIYILWVFAIPFLWFYGNRERFWSRCLLGIVISLLALVPTVWWNMTHDWATFRHVFSTVQGGHSPKVQGNILEFLGSQAALLSPIIYVLLLIAYVLVIVNWRTLNAAMKFCGSLSLVVFIVYLILSCFQKIQGNWSMQAYPTGVVLIAWAMCECFSWGRKSLIIGIATSVLLFGAIVSIPKIQVNSFAPDFPIPYKISPFKHNLGWTAMQKQLEKVGYDPKEHFLFSDKYQMCSILSFYSQGQKRAYFLNMNQIRRNQFSYWPSMAQEQKGNTGFFVIAENAPNLLWKSNELAEIYEQKLKDYFDRVEYVGFKPIFEAYGEIAKGVLLFKCIGYNGKVPKETDLY